jgi:serine/threonine-protein kinase HipA
MNRCPITYEECGTARYSRKGLRRLSSRLEELGEFPYSSEDQRREAVARATKMSIQGIQPKLSVRLSMREKTFHLVDQGGRFIVKPQHAVFPELPENEDLTMRLAAVAGIDVPLHGMVYCRDGSFSYFVKRFDRAGRDRKLAVEDFAQLSGKDRETKYDSSIEKMIDIVDRCTFPAVELAKLFRRLIFCFLAGNEDMHLKNFSLITRKGKIELSPAYDLLNTTIAFLAIGKAEEDIEETALPLKGKKRGLTRRLWIDYLGMERMKLERGYIESVLCGLSGVMSELYALIEKSFLSDEGRTVYLSLLERRAGILGL